MRPSSFGKTWTVLCGLLLLTACGFSPIYGSHGGEGSPVAEALSNVFIENIPDEYGQKLRNKLMDRMYHHGRPAEPTARLVVTIDSSESALAIQKDATSSLSELGVVASYRLIQKDGPLLVSGKASSTVIYNKLDAQFGTLAAKRNAYDRAINEVGEQIVNRVSLFYAEPPAELPDPNPMPKTNGPAVTPEKSWSLGIPQTGDGK